MRSCQDRTLRIVKDLGCDGTEQHSPEWTVAVCRHDDYTRSAFPSIRDDCVGRIANKDMGLGRNLRYVLALEGFQGKDCPVLEILHLAFIVGVEPVQGAASRREILNYME